MKHLESYQERNSRRKVYWIIPFKDKFEDAVVITYLQYVPYDRDFERVRLISDALELTQDAKSVLLDNEFVLLSMEFEIDELTDKVTMPPKFQILSFDDKDELEKDKFIFVGYTNTTKDEVDLKIQSDKYNL